MRSLRSLAIAAFAAGGIASAAALTIDPAQHAIDGVRNARYCEIIPVVRSGFATCCVLGGGGSPSSDDGPEIEKPSARSCSDEDWLGSDCSLAHRFWLPTTLCPAEPTALAKNVQGNSPANTNSG